MLGFVIVLGLTFYFLYYHLVQKRRGLPPGPMPLPVVGNLFHLDQSAPHKTMLEYSKKYGPIFTLWFGPDPNVCVTDYRLMKEYIVKQGDVYAGRPSQFLFEFFNDGRYGIVMTEGEFWKEQRRFSLHVLRDFGFGRNVMEERVNYHLDNFIHQINESIGTDKKEKVLNLKHWTELCVGNIINSLVFGYKYEEGSQSFVKLKQILEDGVKLFSRPEVLLLSVYPWLRHVPLFRNFGFQILEEQRDVFYEWLDRELEQHTKTFDPNAEALDYVSAYQKEIHRRKKADEPMGSFGEWQLKMAIADIWTAGLETTATTIKWAVLYMMHNPDVQEKCAQEIHEILQTRDSQIVTMADRNSLPFTAATVNETQRLGNVLPITLLHSVVQDTVMEGFILKRGTIVLPQVSVVMSDPKVFPDPEKFQPQRFLEADGKTLKKVEELVPFSVGKRACMGESLARMELFLIIAGLIRNFKFAAKPGEPLPSLESVPGFTRAPHITVKAFTFQFRKWPLGVTALRLLFS